MVCMDNLEWMQNDIYVPTRFHAQVDVVKLICGNKI